MAVAQVRSEAMGEISTLLGRGSEFDGKLTFEGTVRIDGKLSGEIFSDDVLVVGEGAEVNAEVDVGEIIVQGTVVGNIRAKRSVEIHAPGRVRGDITTPSLQIDKGVIFEGRACMEGVVEGMRPRSVTGQGPINLTLAPAQVPTTQGPNSGIGATNGPKDSSLKDPLGQTAKK